jgi:hypothetical protein
MAIISGMASEPRLSIFGCHYGRPIIRQKFFNQVFDGFLATQAENVLCKTAQEQIQDKSFHIYSDITAFSFDTKNCLKGLDIS